MLMDYELNVKVNEIIADLVETARTDYDVNIDMVVTQDDKYRNTEYETIVIGLGDSKGMKKRDYYFNAVNEDNNELVDKYYNEPVSFYENNGSCCIMYRLIISPLTRVVNVYQVEYILASVSRHGDVSKGNNEPTYNKIATYDFGKSKFATKVK